MGPVQLLAAALALYPSTGAPSGDYAERLSAAFHRCADDLGRDDVDALLIAATASKESGFRADAVNASGRYRMLGILQLHERYLPVGFPWENVEANTAEFCRKLKRVAKHHDKRCRRGDHHVLSHHFAGFRVTPRARVAVKDVLRRRSELARILGRLTRS